MKYFIVKDYGWFHALHPHAPICRSQKEAEYELIRNELLDCKIVTEAEWTEIRLEDRLYYTNEEELCGQSDKF